MNLLQSFIGLFYPNICSGCSKGLSSKEQTICVSCWSNLPKSYEYKNLTNHTAKLFWGRYPLENAFSTFLYYRGNSLQNMIYDLKYRGNQKVGEVLGKEVGKEVLLSNIKIDVIIPVPLHPAKLQKRGYNQSLSIALGIQEVLNCQLNNEVLLRKVNTDTQTRKTKFERWENVKDIFGIENKTSLENKHVLLVDDVITTGSTIEGCCHSLGTIKGIKISVVAVASA